MPTIDALLQAADMPVGPRSVQVGAKRKASAAEDAEDAAVDAADSVNATDLVHGDAFLSGRYKPRRAPAPSATVRSRLCSCPCKSLVILATWRPSHTSLDSSPCQCACTHMKW